MYLIEDRKAILNSKFLKVPIVFSCIVKTPVTSYPKLVRNYANKILYNYSLLQYVEKLLFPYIL